MTIAKCPRCHGTDVISYKMDMVGTWVRTYYQCTCGQKWFTGHPLEWQTGVKVEERVPDPEES
jgi:hypothetical protein